MKILIDILHPAHVHFFSSFIPLMQQRGHAIVVTARRKDVALELLGEYGIEHISLSSVGGGKAGLARELLSRTAALYKLCRRERPDLLLGVMGASIAPVARLCRLPCIVFYNNENASLTNWYAYPLADAVVTSSSYAKKVRGNHFTYPGYHEYAYLHPSRFTPERRKVEEAGINPDGKYIIVRFVSWQASHDVGEKGITDKKAIVKGLERYAKVYISSESEVPPELQGKVLNLGRKRDLFDVMAHACLVFGEGATMASEAAMLGVPAVYVNSLQLGYLQEQERDYGLVYNFTAQGAALGKALELLKDPLLRERHQQKRAKMVAEKIDVTAWMADFVEAHMRM